MFNSLNIAVQGLLKPNKTIGVSTQGFITVGFILPPVTGGRSNNRRTVINDNLNKDRYSYINDDDEVFLIIKAFMFTR